MDSDTFRKKFFEGIAGYGFNDNGQCVAIKGYINSRTTEDMQ